MRTTKERYLSDSMLSRHIDEAARPQEDISEIVTKQERLLLSAWEKKAKGLPLTDEEQAVRLEHAASGVNGETRQQEALENWKQQQQNQIKSDVLRDRAIRVGREYEG